MLEPKRRNTLSEAAGSSARQSVLSPVAGAADAVRSTTDAGQVQSPAAATRPARPRPKGPRTSKYPFRLPQELLERLRDAAVELRVPMNTICVHALQEKLHQLEEEHGAPIPPRGKRQLACGRPISELPEEPRSYGT